MRSFKNMVLGSAGLALAAAPLPALAQSCITEAEVGAMIRYAAPAMIQSAQTQCAGQPSSAYLSRQGSDLLARYAADQDQVWPAAKSGLLKFVAEEGATGGMNLGQLPDDALRPFIDAVIVEMISAEFPVEDCRKVDKLVQALAPLDPEQMGTLAGAIFSIAEPQNPAICED